MSTTFSGAPRPIPDILTLSTATPLSEEQRAELLAKRLEALSHPTRLRVLRILATASEHTVSVKILTKLLDVGKQGTISNHIRVLVVAGFLECVELRGKGLDIRHFYVVKRQAIIDAFKELAMYLGYESLRIVEAATG